MAETLERVVCMSIFLICTAVACFFTVRAMMLSHTYKLELPDNKEQRMQHKKFAGLAGIFGCIAFILSVLNCFHFSWSKRASERNSKRKFRAMKKPKAIAKRREAGRLEEMAIYFIADEDRRNPDDNSDDSPKDV